MPLLLFQPGYPGYNLGGAFQFNPAFSQSLPVNPTPVSMAPPPADSTVPALLSETRQQNTEIRLSLSKVADRVDRIYDRVQHAQGSEK